MIADILFFMFASILLAGSLGVVLSKNPMYSVLFLVLSFFNAAGLFLLIGAEFLGLLLMMVYVGAIAVMFLFVLMTVDMTQQDDDGKRSPLFVTLVLVTGGVLLFEIIISILAGVASNTRLSEFVATQSDVQNIVQLGQVLFTNYVYPFIAVSMILLVGMVGAIVLTHRKREGALKQDISEQIGRTREESIEIVTPSLGKGIS
ncbi:MAG: NADH:ubiquinone oxidoreductase subunit J [Magnetococcales bacterium]|nr:NADH:ubiquinone oxidoreductase subunit J [Magnetococcales bacterium]|tara:strand:+ start:152 stop:760 length:609 start_codon:yes stop_codon:yes gene_type:complete